MVVPQTVSTAETSSGDRIDFEVAKDVLVNHIVVIKSGAAAWGVAGRDPEHKGYVSTPGRLAVLLKEVTAVNGQSILIQSRQEAIGDVSCYGSDYCGFLVFLPWLKGGDAKLHAGTKFYAFVKEDAKLVSPIRDQNPASREAMPEPAGTVTIIRCYDDHVAPVVKVKLDGGFLVLLAPNEFLSVKVPDGHHVFSVGKQSVELDSAFAKQFYIRLEKPQISKTRGVALRLTEDDDCVDLSAVMEPVDSKNVAKQWRWSRW